MKVLAVDTSGQVASVAIVDELNIIGEYSLNHGKTHSQTLVHMIDELLNKLAASPLNMTLAFFSFN